jgi:LmbE family N-acetylglucosaminyl deacetylase
VLFVAAHPDDETLAMSVAIAEHAGENVHVLILTAGEGSNAINMINGLTVSSWWGSLHNPAAEGYSPLTVAQFAQARQVEATNAVAALTSNSPATLHLGNLPDGGVTITDARNAILAVANSITSGPIKIKGHTYLTSVEKHPDHLAVGNAIALIAAGNPTRFGDRRYYILPAYWDNASTVPNRFWDYPADASVWNRVENGIMAYQTWNPPNSYAIGAHSVPGMFNTLSLSPKSLVHP